MSKKLYIILILIIVGLGIWFVYNGLSEKKDVGIANPASVFCVDNGGRLDMRTDATGGQFGVCVFDNNTECEEWMYFRGQCKMGEIKDNGVSCTAEAKLCPDGFAVGRSGPNCEFAECPAVKNR